MKRVTKLTGLALAIAFTFALSGISPAISQSSNTGADWAWTDGNVYNQNYNPQSQITATNVNNLQVSWIFPLPGPASWWPQSAALLGGGTLTPIVYKGVVYVVTVFFGVYALDASNGNLIWSTNLPIYQNSSIPGFGSFGVGISAHIHNTAVAFSSAPLLGQTAPTIWVAGNNMQVYVLDADTGKIIKSFLTISTDPSTGYGIPGNKGTYFSFSVALALDQKRGVLITSATGTSSSASGRGFVKGWDVTGPTPTQKWITFLSPPQDGSDPSWDISQVNNMTGAWIFDAPQKNAVNLKTLSPSVQNTTLYNDWGLKLSPECSALLGGRSTGGVGESWGGPWVIDPNTGILYFSTNNRNPYVSPCTPGPDLWSSSIVAINDQTGQLIWGFQTSPHDEWDWDCSWNQALANETIGGQQREVVIKTCKTGYMFELDAQTGQMYWYFTPPTNIIPRCQYCQLLDPLNRTQMTISWPAPNGMNYNMYPNWLGVFENDFAFDPSINMIVAVGHSGAMLAHLVPVNSSASNYGYNSGITPLNAYTENNATAFGINAANGNMVWHYTIHDIGYRGGVTTSGGVAYLTLANGYVTMINDNTGALITSKLIGGPLEVLPSIGQTTDGTEELFVTLSAGAVPGYSLAGYGNVIALKLAGSQASTQTTTISGGTITVNTGSTSSGIDPTTFYAIVGVLVVVIVITGVLAMRRRTPAS